MTPVLICDATMADALQGVRQEGSTEVQRFRTLSGCLSGQGGISHCPCTNPLFRNLSEVARH